jgi:hypothetical protein
VTRMKKALTFSNVIAVIALFLALGGSVYAASNKISGAQIKPKSLPGNRIKAKSITGSQLKGGTITAAQIKAGSLTGAQIQAGSLSGTQIKAGSLTGAQVIGSSLTGVTASAIGSVQYVSSTVALTPSETGIHGSAACPSGQKVIGGGATVSNEAEAFVNDSGPSSNRGEWVATAFGAAGTSMTVTAVCTAVSSTTG